MTLAYKAALKEKKTVYDKMVSIANPKHGPQFLAEVNYPTHFTSFNWLKVVFSYILIMHFAPDQCTLECP